jgi:MFS family permease
MKLKTHWFIHIFAVLHFLTSLVCGLLCTSDALLLTVLTIALTLIICLRGKMSVELTVITIVLANVLGYVLGSLLAWLFGLVMDGPVIVHAISTAATTEALGWAMLWFTGRYHDSDQELPEEERDTRLGWLIFAVVAVYLLRVFINLIFSASASGPGEGLTAVKDFLYNPLMLLLIVAGSVIFIQYYKRENKAMSYSGKILSYALYFIFMTLLSALFVGLGLPFSFDVGFSASRLLLLLAVSLVTNAAAFCFVYVADLALTARRKLEIEREKADKARYQYLLLKQQLSPHFLFNSLNVLDALVLDGSKEDASRFIHQLSGIYRYMLRNEDEEVVPLHEEMAYSDMYGSLVKMRWQDSLVIESSVREEDLGHYVIPCSVQLCIENAIKHNSMSPENPLRISISSDGRFVKVSNRLAPKLTGLRSTGLGLKYIKQQYLSHGSSVEVERGEDIFEVKLPLL